METHTLGKREVDLISLIIFFANRTDESLEDLRILCTRFELHAQTFKDWVRGGGGPIDPAWAHETAELRRELHRAQCRAARRIHSAQQIDAAVTATGARCLGALQVYRVQRQRHAAIEDERLACAQTGRFERFDDNSIAFVCDFCDGFLVWEDLRAMPTTRAVQQRPAPPPSPSPSRQPPTPFSSSSSSNTTTTTSPPTPRTPSTASTPNIPRDTNNYNMDDATVSVNPNWQARGISLTSAAAAEAKTVVFAPVAIANHAAPAPGDWRARIVCPYCDEDAYYEVQGEDDMERVRYVPLHDDDAAVTGFESVADFQEHLEWSHAPSIVSGAGGCAVM